jgi:hypothetical protein
MVSLLLCKLARHKKRQYTLNELVMSTDPEQGLALTWCEVAVIACERCGLVFETAGEAP